MKTWVLAGLITAAMSFGVARAANPEFALDENGNARDEVSSADDSPQQKIDPRQTNGILLGKPIFRLDPKYGDICLQTVFGKVNGAQVRVTF